MADNTIDLQLNAAAYVQQAAAALQATNNLDGGLSRLAVTGAGVQRTMAMLTPSRATTGGLAMLAVAAAGAQSDLSRLEAQQTITGQSAAKLGSAARQLARDIPVGNTAARQTVELVSQLGITGDNATRKIGSLSKTFLQMQQATGGNAGQLGAGLVQLERTFGDQGIDPKRVAATGDALTTVAARAGASAQGVLDLTNAIGPFAQSANIGKTATLGISASLARIGQDGYTAANAINTLLSGMSTAVAQGTPELQKYAGIVGMTSKQFQGLYQANPAQALTAVTQGLAGGGGRAQREMAGLGLDGIRTQRVLQALVQSGGLEQSISTATAAYGSGSTGRAARAADASLNDTFTKIQASGEQLAQALGTPLLKPLGQFAGLMNTITGTAARATGGLFNNHAVANIATAGMWGLGALTLARRGGRMLGGASIAGALLGSRPVRGIAGGLAYGMAGEDAAAAQETRLGRYGRPLFTDMSYNPDGRTTYSRMNQRTGLAEPVGGLSDRMFFGAARFGQGYADYRSRVPGGTGPRSLFSPLRPFMAAGEAWSRASAEQAQMGRFNMTGQGQRLGGFIHPETGEAVAGEGALRPRAGGPVSRWMQGVPGAFGSWGSNVRASYASGGLNEVFSNKTVKGFGDAMTTLREETKATAGELGRGRAAIGAFGTAIGEQAKFAGSLGMMGARTVGGGALSLGRSLAGSLGPVGVAAIGIPLAISAVQKNNAQKKAQDEAWQNLDVYGQINAYREASGQATLGSAANGSLATGFAAATSGTNWHSALAVTDTDRAQARGRKPTMNINAKLSDDQIAAQLRGMTTGAMSAGDVQTAKLDLLSQLPPDRANKILGQLSSANTPAAAGSTGGIDQLVRAAADTGWEDVRPGRTQHYSAGSSGGGWNPLGHNKLTATGDQLAKEVVSNIGQHFKDQSATFSFNYSSQTQYRDIDKAMSDALKSGNKVLAAQLSKGFAAQLGAKGSNVSASEIAAHGGSFVAALAAENKTFGGTYRGQLAQGLTLSGQGLAATPTQRVESTQVDQALGGVTNNYLSRLFDNRNAATGANGAVQTSLASPGDLDKLSSAARATVDELTKSGVSYSDIATQADKVSASFADASDASAQLATAISQEAQVRLQASSGAMSPGAAWGQQFSHYAAGMNATGPNADAQRKAGEAGATGMISDLESSMKQRLMTQYSYQTQMQRANEDYNRQVDYANTDFQRQQTRASEDYNKQRDRAEQDFQVQELRSLDDYYTQAGRQADDYNLSVTRSQEDFHTTLSRAQRDFNISMTRMNADAAKAMYDPYKRIQTQAVWDGHQLVANINQQTKAISQQSSNLAQARKLGISTATIQQLGLADAANAQQLQKLIADMMNDPQLAAQINTAVGDKTKAGGLLNSDAGNTAVSRAKEDFAKQIADMEADYSKSVNRAQADFSKAQARQLADFTKSMNRMADDFHKSVARGEADFNQAMSRAADDQALAMSRMADQNALTIKRAQADLTNADKVISTSFADMYDKTQKAMHGKTVDFSKIMVSGLDDTLNEVKKRAPDFQKAFAELTGVDLSSFFGDTNAPGGAMTGSSKNANQYGGPSGGGGWPTSGPLGSSFGDTGWKGIIEGVSHLGFHYGMPTPGQINVRGGASEHGAGRAVDFGDATSPSSDIAKSLVRYARGPNAPIDELIFAPLGIGYKNGVNIGERGYGAATWNEHFNHVHVGVKDGVSLDSAIRGSSGQRPPRNFMEWLIEGWLQVYDNAAGMSTPAASGGPLQDYAKRLLHGKGWDRQWGDFNALEMSEAGWKVDATNPESGAYGLAQALPPGKYASAGADWRTNGETQLRWMVDYIAGRYGDPSKAWAFHRANNWYGDGAIFNGPRQIGVGERGPEALIPLDTGGVTVLAQALGKVIGADDFGTLAGLAHATHVTYHGDTVTYDQSTRITGPITVQSNDPNDMASKLAAKTRRDNLTSLGSSR